MNMVRRRVQNSHAPASTPRSSDSGVSTQSLRCYLLLRDSARSTPLIRLGSREL